LIQDPIQYPSLHTASSKAAQNAQRRFLGSTVVQLTLLILAAGAASVSWRPSAIASAAAAALAFLCSLIERTSKFDDQWFACRAIAENAKSAAWLYVMDCDREEPARRAALMSELATIRQRFPESRAKLADTSGHGAMVTNSMQRAAQLDWRDRLERYRSERIRDQISWYTKKAAFNARRESNWSIAVLALEFATMTLAIVLALTAGSVNAVGPLTAATAAGIAWVQTKRFSDLSSSYRVAAEDLQLLYESSSAISDCNELRSLVRDVEQAISREHSIWRVKRGV
jgi:hypothetical protein